MTVPTREGLGSDLDLLLLDEQAWGGQVERLQRWPLADLNRDLRWVL